MTLIFDSENEKRPYIAANAIILRRKDNQEWILLGKRKNVAGAGSYYPPGGHIREGEKIEETLVREVKEETGLDIEPGKFLWWEENFQGPHHLTLYFEAILKDKNQKPKLLEPQKCAGWDYFPLNKPPKPLWVTLERFLKEHHQKQRVERFAQMAKDYIGVGVAAVILNDKNEVLLQKRGPKARNEVGKWKLPGGGIEWGEKQIDALKREIKEELDVEVEVIKFLHCLDDIIPDEKEHWLVPFYLCKIKKGTPKIMEPEKAAALHWFPLKKLPSNLAFGTNEVLKNLKI